MKPLLTAVLAALVVLTLGPGAATAQDAAPAAPAPAPAAAPSPTFTRQTPIPNPGSGRPGLLRRPAALAHSRAATPATAYSAPLPLGPAGSRLVPGEQIPPAELEAYLDGLVRDAMAREHVAGVTISVVQNGQLILKKGYGFARLSPARRVDPDRTLFRIGSISKTFTWIALMKEVEAGRIRLEAPVNLYLPETLQVRNQGFDTPIRVSNLLDHSAGFEDRALGHLFEDNASRIRPLDVYLRQERPRRVREPGAVASYSNYGAGLAGAAVSYVAQRPFERLIEDEIFVPLGLAHTTFREPRATLAKLPAPMSAGLAADLSQGYLWTPTGYRQRPFEFIGQIAPAGSASSTAADMARYMTMLLNGGTLDEVVIFGSRAAQAFRTPLRRTPPGINGWAHGFAVYALPGGQTGYGHAGATLSFQSNMVLVPGLGLGVFISTNTESGAPLAERLPEAIVRQFYAPAEPPPHPPSVALVGQRGLYEGYYVSTRRAHSGLESFVTLLSSGVGVAVSPEGRLVTRSSRGVELWTPEADLTKGRFASDSNSSHLVFGLRAGQPANFATSFNGALYERAGFWRRPTTLLALAAAAGLAAIGTLGGVIARNRREFRETSIQSLMSQVQNTQAALWLTAIVMFLIWASKAGDLAKVVFDWPGPMLMLASACALVAALLVPPSLLALPYVWRGGRRVDSWSSLRKTGFSLTVLVYAAFSVILFIWGALVPFSG